jgi:hypothetical protein
LSFLEFYLVGFCAEARLGINKKFHQWDLGPESQQGNDRCEMGKCFFDSSIRLKAFKRQKLTFPNKIGKIISYRRRELLLSYQPPAHQLMWTLKISEG